jgi:hypothetical protein
MLLVAFTTDQYSKDIPKGVIKIENGELFVGGGN